MLCFVRIINVGKCNRKFLKWQHSVLVFERGKTGLLHSSSIFLLPFMMGCYTQLESDIVQNSKRILNLGAKRCGGKVNRGMRLNEVLKA